MFVFFLFLFFIPFQIFTLLAVVFVRPLFCLFFIPFQIFTLLAVVFVRPFFVSFFHSFSDFQSFGRCICSSFFLFLFFHSFSNFHSFQMQTAEIVGFSVSVSIATLYMRVFPAQHIQNFEDIAHACSVILELLGRALYLQSLFELWSSFSNSMFIMEQMLWLDQPPETSMSLVLPADPRPLCDVYLPLINKALNGLQHFHGWFHTQYDTTLHRETDNMI